MWSGKEAVAALLLCVSPIALGAGDPARGERKAAVCVECHGVGGQSTDPTIPKLAGQRPDYIATATTEFTNGTRSNPAMDNVLDAFADPQDLADIAAYFASQPPMKGEPTGSELTALGEELITMARCTFCHFVAGKRHSPYAIEPPPPHISGQHKPYLIKAINDIRDGKRPADSYGLMKEDISRLTPREIEAIAEYLSGL